MSIFFNSLLGSINKKGLTTPIPIPIPILPNVNTKIIVELGQSNMEGVFGNTSHPDYPFPSTHSFYWNGNAPEVLKTTRGNPGRNGSHANYFAEKYHDLTGDGVVMVEAAESGTGTQPETGNPNWSDSSTLRNTAKNLTNSALSYYNETTPYAALWCQGESDGGSLLNVEGYTEQMAYDGLESVINWWFNLYPDSVFIISELGYTSTGATGGSDPFYDIVRNIQRQMAQKYERVFIGFTGAKNFRNEGKLGDLVHYTWEGNKEMGEALATKLAALRPTGEVTNVSDPVLIDHSLFMTEVGDATYWLNVLKTSETPFTASKPYIVVWSTDHVPNADGRIFWGEMDSPDFTGFTGVKGVIVSNYQSETPCLRYMPSSFTGISDEWFLYYHSNGQPGGTSLQQETRLITTSGGDELHLCNWTERGVPLGKYNDDDHTGYAKIFGNEPPFICSHLTVGGDNPKTYMSTSDTGLNFTRLQQIENTTNMPDGSTFRGNQLCPFKKNGIWYSFIIERVGTQEYVSLVKMNRSNFHPTEYLQRLSEEIDGRTMTHYIEGNTAYLYYSGGSNSYKTAPNYFITCDISGL